MSTLSMTVWRAFQGAEEQVDPAAGGPRRWRVLLLLACVLALDSSEGAAVSAVAGSLKQAFSISNTQLGLVIAASTLVGAVLTIPIGILVDRLNRKYILVAAICLWGTAMAVSGTATSFLYVLLTRLFLGVVTAAANPSIASLVGDFFPAAARACL